MRARGRQAQRSRQRRLHQPASHLLRDAGQLLLWRLLQGAGDPAGLGARHQGLRPRPQAPGRHHLPRRRGRLPHLEEGDGLFGRQDHPHRHVRQFLVGGRHRAVRALLGDLPRPGRQDCRRPAGQRRPGRRPLPRVLEPRVHAVRAARPRRPRQPAQALDRHRHGPRAHDGHPAGRAVRLRHRPVQGADRGVRGGDRRAGQGRSQVQPPGDRRPSARHQLPDRGGRAALQRGPRLRAAPHHAPRHAARPSAGRQGAADVPAGAGAGAADGRDLPGAGARPGADHRNAEAGRDALSQDAGEGPGPAGRGDRRAQGRRHAQGRRRLQALRHLRLPARPDAGCAEGARHQGRHRGLRCGDEEAEGEGARVLGGIGRSGSRRRLVRGQGARRRHRLPGLRHRDRRGRDPRDPQGRQGGQEPQGRR